MGKRKVSSNGTVAAEVESVREVQMSEQQEAAAANAIAAIISGQPVDVDELRAAEPVVRLCACGCGQPIVGQKAKFAPGHDQRYKGELLRRYDGGDEAAGAELVERGWRTQAGLDGRREKASGKVAASVEGKRERLVAKLDRVKAEAARLEQQLMALGG